LIKLDSPSPPLPLSSYLPHTLFGIYHAPTGRSNPQPSRQWPHDPSTSLPRFRSLRPCPSSLPPLPAGASITGRHSIDPPFSARCPRPHPRLLPPQQLGPHFKPCTSRSSPLQSHTASPSPVSKLHRDLEENLRPKSPNMELPHLKSPSTHETLSFLRLKQTATVSFALFFRLHPVDHALLSNSLYTLNSDKSCASGPLANLSTPIPFCGLDIPPPSWSQPSLPSWLPQPAPSSVTLRASRRDLAPRAPNTQRTIVISPTSPGTRQCPRKVHGSCLRRARTGSRAVPFPALIDLRE